jgi:restriction endonuclease Mrr
MATSKALALENYTVEQLQAALAAKQQAATQGLREKRAALLEELRAVEKQLEAAGFGSGRAVRAARGAGAPRGPRGVPMATLVLRAILASGEKNLGVPEILEYVTKHSTSSNPKPAVGQALVRLKKEGHVETVSRGIYRVTASGKKLAAAEDSE